MSKRATCEISCYGIEKLFFTVTLMIALCINPVVAKSVSLDVQHKKAPTKSQASVNRPYFVELRKRIEEHWTVLDPWVGVTVRVRFQISPDGTIFDIDPLGLTSDISPEENLALQRCSIAIAQSFPADHLPPGQDTVPVIAEFKSKSVASNNGNRVNLSQIVESTALAALVGFSIYAICKWGVVPLGSSGSSYSYRYHPGHACIGASDCRVCSSCSSCQHCNSGYSPCNIWFLNY